jgi:formate hydrogenlyase subunit 3/multisubunit Na+/H+ antiporter MnhD subunit
MDLLLFALVLVGLGGLLALILSRAPELATTAAVVCVVSGCSLGLVAVADSLVTSSPVEFRLDWDGPHGPFVVGLDSLSAFFLLPVLILSAGAAIYGGSYLHEYRARKRLGPVWFFFCMFVAGMILVVIARTAVLFLLAWEVMSLSAFFLVSFEHEQAEARRAGWVYLVATHLGVAFLVALFALLSFSADGTEFSTYVRVANTGPILTGVLFVLALIGFGTKAGLVPLHVWLPEAHAAAPSFVSALMSGVMIKMGVYGLLRTLTFLGPAPPWWGVTLVIAGGVTALIGIALATIQRDIKRVLAYSSIENAGLIVLALGVGLWGMSSGRPAVAALGVTACLLHIWNHAAMKGLMFFAAGSVVHATGTRDMEKLGGLLKQMPWTGTVMVVGAVAIALLPPLNGFTGKWLLYLGLAEWGLGVSPDRGLGVLLLIGLLALVGGLSAVTFVRLCGISLLGSSRHEPARHAHDPSWQMRGPMLALAVMCLVAATVPDRLAASFGGTRDVILGVQKSACVGGRDPEIALSTLGAFNSWTLAAIVGLAVVLFVLVRKGAVLRSTWGCGYVAPTPRMQYTGRSFAEMVARRILPRFLRLRSRRKAPTGLFPSSAEYASDCADPINRRVYEPFFTRWAQRFAWLRILQQGKVHIYLLYILFTVVLALAWTAVRGWLLVRHE